MQESLNQKDQLLQKYEQEIKNCQDDILINMDRMKELKNQEEQF